MTSYADPEQRIQFLQLHKKVIQEHQLSVMVNDSISRQRKFIDQTIKKLISSLRSFCFLNTWYPRLSMSDITLFLQSSIYHHEKNQIVDNPSSLPYQTNITISINTFLRSIHNYMNSFLKCVVVYFDSPRPDIVFNPCDKPLSFFASSTFPSLFGYCWCVEQGISYVEALIQLLEIQTSNYSINSSEFRNSFIRDIIRQFLHMSEVQNYLRMALSTDYWALINEESVMQNEDSKEWFEILLSYVKLFIEDLLRSIFHMPTLIRYFYKRVADIDDSGLLVEFLFFDYLVQPALMNPKLFALIPETASQGSGSYMTTLTRLFRWSLNPSSIPEKYKFIEELEVFQNLNVRQIINTLSNFDGKIKGVYATEFHTITEIRYHPLLLSVNDIAFLLRIINDTIDEIDIDPNEKKKIVQLCSFQSNLNLENDELIDFWFQSFKDPEVPKNSLIISNDESILLKLPIIRTPAVPTFDPKDLYVKTIYHLQGYLQMAHSNSKSPQTLIKYLEEQERRANQTNSIEWLTRTQAIKAKLERCERTENQILKSLFDIINYGLKESSSRLAVSFRHEEFTDEITNKLRDISNMIAQLSPNIHQSLLRLYLHRNKEIKIDVERNKLKLLAKPQEWIDFLTPMTQQIVAFGQSLKLDKSDCFRLTRQFHSEICSSLTFNMYRTANPQFESEDQSINRKIKRILKKFLKENYSKTLDQLFKTPSCFESAINTLKQGAAVGAPLEKLEQITSSMNIIQNIYLFESGERCPGDDLLPLFIYILLRSKLPYLVSLTNYIRHFLMSIEETVNVMDSKEKYVITTFLTATEHIIDEANKFKKKSKSSSKKLE